MNKTKKPSPIKTEDTISDIWKGFKKEELLEGFDDVITKVKKQKVPKWDHVDQ